MILGKRRARGTKIRDEFEDDTIENVLEKVFKQKEKIICRICRGNGKFQIMQRYKIWHTSGLYTTDEEGVDATNRFVACENCLGCGYLPISLSGAIPQRIYSILSNNKNALEEFLKSAQINNSAIDETYREPQIVPIPNSCFYVRYI